MAILVTPGTEIREIPEDLNVPLTQASYENSGISTQEVGGFDKVLEQFANIGPRTVTSIAREVIQNLKETVPFMGNHVEIHLAADEEEKVVALEFKTNFIEKHDPFLTICFSADTSAVGDIGSAKPLESNPSEIYKTFLSRLDKAHGGVVVHTPNLNQAIFKTFDVLKERGYSLIGYDAGMFAGVRQPTFMFTKFGEEPVEENGVSYKLITVVTDFVPFVADAVAICKSIVK